MNRTRVEPLFAVLKGMLAAIGVTLLSMAVVAGALLIMQVPDSLLRALNQVIKAAAIAVGVAVAVERGGQRGFAAGMALASLYMILGYSLCIALGGTAYDTADMLGEILLGAALGGIAGAIRANLPPRAAHRRGSARRSMRTKTRSHSGS